MLKGDFQQFSNFTEGKNRLGHQECYYLYLC